MSAKAQSRKLKKSTQEERALTEEELIQLTEQYLKNPDNLALHEKLAAEYLKVITRLVMGFVRGTGTKELFIEEAISTWHEEFAEGLRGQRLGIRGIADPKQVRSYLSRWARRTVFTAIAQWYGRAKHPPVFVSLEGEKREGATPTYVIDRGPGRQAAERFSTYQSIYYDPEKVYKEEVEMWRIFDKLIDEHGESALQRDKASAAWLKVRIYEGRPVEKIASERGTTTYDVWHLLRHDVMEITRRYQEITSRPPEH